jgi:hypothetical protein
MMQSIKCIAMLFAWTQVALDALAAGMLVTLLLDTWRLVVGGIVESPAAAAGLQWAVEQDVAVFE